MKNIDYLTSKLCVRLAAMAICTGSLLNTQPILAGDSKAVAVQAAPEEAPFSNWVNLTLGGMIMNGNRGQLRENNPTLGPIFGGIEDMHLEQQVFNGSTLLTLDGHAIFNNSDYLVKIELSKVDVGYVKAGFTQFCSYSNGDGGYLPSTAGLPNTLPDGLFFPGSNYALYRGSLWVELGLRVPNFPELTARYEHAYRNGQKASTSWGTAYTGPGPMTGQQRKITPAFRDLDETRDIFTFDAKYTFGKPEAFGNTDVALGMIYEFDNTNDSLNWQNAPGASPTALAYNTRNVPQVANDYKMTQSDQLSLALYNGHISTVTHFGDKLWLTSGFSYSAESTDIGGSRIYAPTYGVAYSPYYNNLAYARSNGPYINLGGGSNVGQTVAALNVMWTPIESLTISPSVRFEATNTTSTSTMLTEISQVAVNGTRTVNKKTGAVTITPARITTYAGTTSQASLANSNVCLTEFAESLQIRYTGIDNWVFYAQGDWEQPTENRADSTPQNSLTYYGNATTKTTGSSRLNFFGTNTNLVQKYSTGANWYPLRTLNTAIQYYLQMQDINQTIHTDDPIRSNQRLISQYWNTNDVNFRLTWQPFSTLSLVSRYDFQKVIINSQWATDSDWLINGQSLSPYGQSSYMINQIISESLTWSPIDRLYFQGSLAYVKNTLGSPATNPIGTTDPVTPYGLQNSTNDYWTASAGFGLALDRKTELRGDMSFYRANNYVNNAAEGVPYGAGATEYTFSLSLSRQITRNLSASFAYSLDSYTDQLSGGNSNYLAQMLTAGLQMKF